MRRFGIKFQLRLYAVIDVLFSKKFELSVYDKCKVVALTKFDVEEINKIYDNLKNKK